MSVNTKRNNTLFSFQENCYGLLFEMPVIAIRYVNDVLSDQTAKDLP